MSSMSVKINAPVECGEVEMPEPEEPVKIEKLPATVRTSNTNLDVPPTNTRENEYARLIKKLQGTKLAEKKVNAQSKASNADPSDKSITISSKATTLDHANMIKSSGISIEHANIPKPVFQVPIAKLIQPTFGFVYKESKVTLEGEPFEASLDKSKKQMSRAQFLQMS